MSGKGKAPDKRKRSVTSSEDGGAATSSVPTVGGSHADAVAQGMTVEDLQNELDRLKAYVDEVKAERDAFCKDNILLYARWQRGKIKRKKIKEKYHDAKEKLQAVRKYGAN